jgi:TPR repeat protein
MIINEHRQGLAARKGVVARQVFARVHRGQARLIPLFGILMLVLGVAFAAPLQAGVTEGWQAFGARDFARAEAEWRPLAEAGNRNAAFGLGLLADQAGRFEEAALWFEAAAKAGLPNAQILIAQRYAEGRGVKADPLTAYVWFSRAMQTNTPNADKARAALAATMTKAQIEAGEALAKLPLKR